MSKKDLPAGQAERADPARCAQRPPRQARGLSRVEAVLDAAAELLAREGLAGVTMHSVAKGAGASIGSLYHFFADRDGLLRALADRHERALAAITAELARVPGEEWRAQDAAGWVERLLTPYFRYIEYNPTLLQMGRGSPDQTLMFPHIEAGFRALLDTVLAVRLPTVDAQRRQVYALALTAIPKGILQLAMDFPSPTREALMAQARQAALAYVRAIESEPGHP
ncbi:TetR/AcrR family transcriptional regulator [Pseudomonas sp. RIT-PI-AD]|uniref:TetR/AcrR family transcriptional regulator n=1 Tax=Pseudomonas sp. RIT-PI-AD TaxID=3035294 RepID=UPI0021D9BEDA|nr:TetR/AcrR family transcriptional regulator [Pseudomonas sp. RIT-PI-AD]